MVLLKRLSKTLCGFCAMSSEVFTVMHSEQVFAWASFRLSEILGGVYSTRTCSRGATILIHFLEK